MVGDFNKEYARCEELKRQVADRKFKILKMEETIKKFTDEVKEFELELDSLKDPYAKHLEVLAFTESKRRK